MVRHSLVQVALGREHSATNVTRKLQSLVYVQFVSEYAENLIVELEMLQASFGFTDQTVRIECCFVPHLLLVPHLARLPGALK